jgi:hypothetical protein
MPYMLTPKVKAPGMTDEEINAIPSVSPPCHYLDVRTWVKDGGCGCFFIGYEIALTRYFHKRQP